MATLSDGALPVTWLYFRGQEKNKDVQLDWATASEQHTSHFIIERSFNGIDFVQIGRVNAAGNSSTTHTYQFIDVSAMNLDAKTLFYRLRQVDIDGKFVYSSIVTIIIRKDKDQVVKVYPNPFNSTLTLLISTSRKAEPGDRLDLYNVNGTLVYSRRLSDRLNSVPILLNDMPILNSGTYIMKLTLNGEISSVKIIRQ
jgi:hypothetical protein